MPPKPLRRVLPRPPTTSNPTPPQAPLPQYQILPPYQIPQQPQLHPQTTLLQPQRLLWQIPSTTASYQPATPQTPVAPSLITQTPITPSLSLAPTIKQQTCTTCESLQLTCTPTPYGCTRCMKIYNNECSLKTESRRPSHACDQCRARKRKCVRTSNGCQRCTQAGIACLISTKSYRELKGLPTVKPLSPFTPSPHTNRRTSISSNVAGTASTTLDVSTNTTTPSGLLPIPAGRVACPSRFVAKCSASFNTAPDAIAHDEDKHNDLPAVFWCPECPFQSAKRDVVLKHRRYNCQWRYHDTGRGHVQFRATKQSPWAAQGEPQCAVHPDEAKALNIMALSINYKMIQDGLTLQ